MAKKGIFKGFFSRMKRNAKKEKKEKIKMKKNACECGMTCRCCRHYGIGLWGYGSVLAMIISHVQGSSLFWTLIHGLLSWFYIIYKLFTGLKFF